MRCFSSLRTFSNRILRQLSNSGHTRRRRLSAAHAAVESLERRALLTTVPAITTFELLNDTGIANDNITTDSRLTGEVDSSASGQTMDIGMDPDNDGDDDTIVSVDPITLTFDYDPGLDSMSGSHTIVATPYVYDPVLMDFVAGTAVSITITIESTAQPVVSDLDLENDTGTPADYVTTDPTVAGVAEEVPTGVTADVDIDVDGDDVSDMTVTADSSGNFSADITSLVSTGSLTVKTRASYFDPMLLETVEGEWASLSFTYTT